MLISLLHSLILLYMNFCAFKYSGKKKERNGGTMGNAVEGVIETVRIYVSMFVFVGVHDDEFCSQFT